MMKTKSSAAEKPCPATVTMHQDLDLEIEKKLPPALRDTLLPFQKEGVQFAVTKKGRCLIADEMGLGKTLQAISVALIYRKEWPLLIIVPSSLKFSWIEEIEKWLPDVLPEQINLIQCGSDISGIADSLITIVTYGLLRLPSSKIIREAVSARNFQVIICDESHSLRNGKTLSSKTVVPLVKAANRRILLSGTPALAKPVELYPQIDAICPGQFGSFWQFTDRYCDAHYAYMGKFKKRKVDGASHLEELQQRLANLVMIRREKSSVLTQLPPKQRQRILFELKQSPLKQEILEGFSKLNKELRRGDKTVYRILQGDACTSDSSNEHSATPENLPSEKNENVFSQISKLCKLSGEAKIGPVREYIETLCENEQLKFLVFAYHHVMMDGVQQSLWDMGVKFVRIDGHTKAIDRQAYVTQFQSDPKTRVAVLSILAAGVGLTFTAAKLVVVAELYWTPGVLLQCEDRAHRIGQTSSLPVHYLVARGTMDEWVWSAVCKKTLVTSAALTGKCQVLDHQEGDNYQQNILSNADPWISEAEEHVDVAQLIQSQRAPDQPSITEFFSQHSTKMESKNIHKKRKMPMDGGKEPSNPTSGDISNEMNRVSKQVRRRGLGKEEEEEVIDFNSYPFKQELTITNPCSKMSKAKLSDIITLSSEDEDDIFKPGPKRKKIQDKVLQTERKTKKQLATKTEARYACSNLSTQEENRARICAHAIDSDIMTVDIRKSHIIDRNAVQHRPYCPGSSLAEQSKSRGRGMDCALCDCDVQGASPKQDKPHKRALGRSMNSGEGVTEALLPSVAIGEGQGAEISQEHEWSCTQCTFLNHKDISECEMCETPKKKKKTFRHTPGSSERGDNNLLDRKDIVGNCLLSQMNDVVEKFCIVKDKFSASKETASTVRKALGSPKTSLPKCDSQMVCGEFPSGVQIAESRPESPDLFDDEIQIDSSICGVEEKTQDNCHGFIIEDELRVGECVQNILSVQTERDNCISPTVALKRDSAEVSSSPSCVFSSSCDLSQNSGEVFSTPAVCAADKNAPTSSQFTDSFTTEDPLPTFLGTKSPGRPNETQVLTLPTSLTPNTSAATSPASAPVTQEAVSTSSSSVTTVHHSSAIADLRSSRTPERLVSDGESDFSAHGFSSAKSSPVRSPVHCQELLKFSCSVYTGRIYVYDDSGLPLQANFHPVDLEVGNSASIPGVLQKPQYQHCLRRFLREWSSMTDTKKRLLAKRSIVFVSPLAAYEAVKSTHGSRQRHLTKENSVASAKSLARNMQGSVRIVAKHSKLPISVDKEFSVENPIAETGIAQAITEAGLPLCLQCQKVIRNPLLSEKVIANPENAWQFRLCSFPCMDQYWTLTKASYCRDQLYDIQHGVCQLCHFSAHEFFTRVKCTRTLVARADLVNKSPFRALASTIRRKMVEQPMAGQFWHVDHITPVWQGGGMCQIDNLRTLCTPCHTKVTQTQAGSRARAKKLLSASSAGDISVFFQKA